MLFKKLLSCTMAAVITACSVKLSAVADIKTYSEPQKSAAEVVSQPTLVQGDMFSQDGLLYTQLEDGTYEVGYDYNGEKPKGDVTIPETVNGRMVTRIAEAGFADCDELESVVVPDSVISAGANAFYGTPFLNEQTSAVKYAGKVAVGCASNAKKATVKRGTLGLADRLFCSAENITSVTLPDGLVNLGSMTFQCCRKLASVNLPDSLTEIGAGVFAECSELRSITIPDSVTSIGAYAFYKSGLGRITIPESVTTIGKGAFEDSLIATNGLTIGNGYINIGGCAFNGTPFYSVQRDVKYAGSVLLGCSINTTELTIREGTTAIADLALSGRENLTSVTIPNSVKTIGSDAFFNCPKLTKITIPKGTESIGKDAFRLCGALAKVSIPSSVKTIGSGAFYGCSKLAKITVPKGVEIINEDTFKHCVSLAEVSVPSSVQTIGEGAFYGCSKLAGITLPEGVKSIGKDAFRLCVLLVEVSLPSSAKTIGSGAFYGCSKLAGITLPEGVKSIGKNAFGLCAELAEVSLPLSVKTVGSGAFYGCTKLKTVHYAGSAVDWASGISIGDRNDPLLAVRPTIELAPKKPSAVTELAVTDIAQNNLTLSWKESKIADSYRIDVYENDKWTTIGTTYGNDTKLTVNDLEPFTKYDFRVIALARNITSAAASVSAKTKGLPITGLKASSSANSVTLSWKKTATADSYEIKMLKNDKWVSVAKVKTASYTVSGLSSETSYDFKVFSIMGGEYSSSASVSAKTPWVKPAAVTELKASSSVNSVKLTWNKTATADSYEIKMLKDDKWVSVAKVTGGSYTVSGLSANTSYKFKVFSLKSGKYGNSASVSAKTLQIKPATVTGLKASSSVNSVTLSWNKTTTADSYEINMYKNGKWVYVAKVTGGSYTVKGLSANTSYKFKVFSLKSGKYSDSVSVSAKTLSDKPVTVTGLKASSSVNSVTLSWNKTTTADSYEIDMYRNGKWVYVAKVTGGSYTVKGLSANTSYNFKVFSLKGNKYSNSAGVSAKTLSDKPLTVTGLKASSSANSVTLSWNKTSTADSYEIDMYKNGKWVYVAKVTGGSYTVSGLSTNTSYNFKVFSFKGSKYSNSASVSAKTTAAAAVSGKPVTVTGLKAVSGANSVTLSWNKTSTADSYEIDMYKNGKWVYVAKITGNAFLIGGLSPNTSYNFKVFSFKGNQYSNSASVSAKTTAVATASSDPMTVTGLKASSGTNSVTLSWNKTATADSYEIDMYKNGKWVYVAKVTGGSYTVSGLSANTSYNFKVFSFKGSKYSNSASVSAKTTVAAAVSGKPVTVTGLKASSGTNSVTLSWNKTDTADSYEIDMYKNGKWVYVAKITGGSYTVSGLSADTLYYFKVFSFKGSQYSNSASVSASTLPNKPVTVTGLKASSGANSITLSWNKTDTADSYEIDMYKNGRWVYVAKVTGSSYTVSGLSASTYYNFKVFSFKGSQYSDSARITANTAISFGSYTSRMLAAAPISSGLSGTRVMMKGIDVSGWQGEIDFKLVKQSGVDFVIVKAGEGPVIVDTWEKNYANAKEAGLKVGAYWFCTSTTLEDAKKEAQLFIKALKGKKLDFPVYLDMELTEQFDNGKEFCTQLVETFCTLLENAGYYAGVYCSTYWYTNYVDDAARLKRPNWIAQYDDRCKYNGSHGIWQYDAGEVDGVEFDCDLNWGYFDYSSYIKAHKRNGF